jgi:hypothetical protein
MHVIDDAEHGSLDKISNCSTPLSIVLASIVYEFGFFCAFSRDAGAGERRFRWPIMPGKPIFAFRSLGVSPGRASEDAAIRAA